MDNKIQFNVDPYTGKYSPEEFGQRIDEVNEAMQKSEASNPVADIEKTETGWEITIIDKPKTPPSNNDEKK